MCFQIVSTDFELRLDLPFEVHIEERLHQILGVSDSPAGDERSRKVLSRRLVDLITAMLEVDLLPPTSKQTKYAMAISRELSIELPEEALRYREAMTVFLGRHAERYRAVRDARKAIWRQGGVSGTKTN